MADRGDQQALLGVAGHDRRPGVAPRQRPRTRVETQIRLRFLGTVTLDAVLQQDRTHLRLEEADLLGCRRGRVNLGSHRRGDGQEANEGEQGRQE